MESGMKHFVRDAVIWTLSITGVVYVYRLWKRLQGPLVRVVVFHDVQNVEWFSDAVAFLKSKYNLLTPEAFSVKDFDTRRINVLITFDDGYASWVDVCLPILKEEETKALFFINSGLIDTFDDAGTQKQFVSDRLMLSPCSTLSWEGVKKLINAGHTVGGHTVTHPRLSELQEHMQKEEIEGDKIRIEEMLGITLSMFAYPFGQKADYGTTTQKLVSEAGYANAFTTEGVFVDMKNPYSLSRLCFEEGMNISVLARWIDGGYDVYVYLKSIFLSKK